MSPLAVMPSLDRAVVGYLKSITEIEAITGPRIGWELYGTSPSIRLAGISAARSHEWELSAGYQIEAWGASTPDGGEEDQSSAETLARLIREAVLSAAPRELSDGILTAADVTLEPWYSPDPDTGRARYLQHALFTASPLETP